MTTEPGTRELAGLQIALSTPRAAAELLLRWAQDRNRRNVHLVNAYTIALSDRDARYAAIFKESALNLPDGRPLVWSSKIGNGPALTQVRGPQLMLDTLDYSQGTAIRHFFLGGTDALLSQLMDVVKRQFHAVTIAGSYSPPFRELSDDDLRHQDELIRDSGADIVWVGLGTPKQDFETARVARVHGIVAVAVGAAFDFAAGTKPTAPRWMSSAGLEWLFRLLSEPKRLWRRYLFGNPRFILALLKALK